MAFNQIVKSMTPVLKTGDALGQEIEALFQIVSDKKESISINEPGTRKRVTEESFQYIIADLEKIIKRHLNLDISIKYLSDSKTCGVVTIPNSSLLTIGRDIDHIRLYHTSNTNPKTASDLIKIMEAVRRDEVVDPERLIKKYFKFELIYDIVGFMCCRSEYNENLSELTAGEVTADILHELGHAINNLRRVGSIRSKLEVAKTHYQYFIENSSNEEKQKLASHLIQVEKTKKQSDPTTIGMLEAIPVEIKQADDNSDKASNVKSFFKTIVDIWGVLLASTINNFVIILINDMEATGTHKQYIGKDNIPFIDQTAQTFKELGVLDDLPGHRREFQKSEIEADSFAIKHGYGHHLSSATLKVIALNRYTSGAYQRKSKTAYNMSMVYGFIYTVCLPDFEGRLYEDVGQRIKTNKLELIKYLKTNGDNPKLVQMYLRSLDLMESSLLKAEALIKRRNRVAIIRRMFTFMSPGWLYKVLISGSFYDEISKFMQHVETLKNNDLYVSAARLSMK